MYQVRVSFERCDVSSCRRVPESNGRISPARCDPVAVWRKRNTCHPALVSSQLEAGETIKRPNPCHAVVPAGCQSILPRRKNATHRRAVVRRPRHGCGVFTDDPGAYQSIGRAGCQHSAVR